MWLPAVFVGCMGVRHSFVGRIFGSLRRHSNFFCKGSKLAFFLTGLMVGSLVSRDNLQQTSGTRSGDSNFQVRRT